MSLQEQFLAEVEAFLARTGTVPTQFGQRALNDPAFVGDLRRGRVCSLRTVDRVRGWMADQSRPAGSKAA